MPPQTLTAQATADATGKATWTFPLVTRGQWWHVAGIVPTAPTAAKFTLRVNGANRFSWLGPLPGAAVVVTQGSSVSITGTGLVADHTYAALLTGSWHVGEAIGVPPQGPSSFVQTSKVTITTVLATIVPAVKTVGVFTGRVLLKGTTTAVALIPSTRTPTYWENMKIGWAVWSTDANTGTFIYIGDSTGGTPTGWARIPSGKTKLMGSFSVAWGNAWVARVAGKTGDHVNVWAA
jgi:hypothetical protein